MTREKITVYSAIIHLSSPIIIQKLEIISAEAHKVNILFAKEEHQKNVYDYLVKKCMVSPKKSGTDFDLTRFFYQCSSCSE